MFHPGPGAASAYWDEAETDITDGVPRVSVAYVFLTEHGIAKRINNAEDLSKTGGGTSAIMYDCHAI